MLRWTTLAVLVLALGCGDDDGPPEVDAGEVDGGSVDASSMDGATDAGGEDAGEPTDGGAGVSCADNSTCTASEWCAASTCDAEGECTAIPEVCTDEIDPVCGCDGNTYSNACEANVARVNVAARGACPTDGGMVDAGTTDAGATSCTTNVDCVVRSLYCAKAAGDCDGTGACITTPRVCPRVMDPVCGCNGTTYDNDCLAAAEGVNVASRGACAVACELRPREGCCFDDGDCGSRSQRCARESCTRGGEGSCVTTLLEPGTCWETADCLRGEVCVGADICACGARCLVPDSPGRCTSRI